jgi:hypothetical protein
MSSRRIITQAILCIAAVSAAMPAAAHGGSLLSGYGGPGQGSQVILGSALVNGPPNGGGGSRGGGSGSEGSSTGTGESSTAAKAASGVAAGAVTRSGGGGNTPTGGASHRHAARAGGHGSQAGRRVSGSLSGGSRPYPVSAREAAVRRAAEGSEPLGVSGSDLLYILLALGALILTGFLTQRMAHTSAARGAGS